MSNAPYSQGNQGRSPQSGKTIWAWVAIACIGGAILAVAAFRFFNAQDPVVAEANQAQPAPVPPPPVDFDPAEMPLDGPPLTGEPVEPLAPGDTDPSATSPPSDAGSAPASNAIPLKPIHVFGGAPLRHWDSITHLDVSPDGKYAVSIADNCRIVVWDLTTGKEVKVLAEGQGAFGRVRDTNLAGAKFSGDGTRVCTHTDKKLTMWKWPSLEVEAETKTSGEVYSLACSHDGSLVLAVMDSSDEGIVFKLDNGKFKRVRGFKDAGRHATLSPDGKFAAFPVSFDTDVFDVASGEKRIAKAPGEDLHFSSDSQRFAVIDRFTSDNATIRILDSRDGTEIEKTELADLKRVSLTAC